MFFTDDDRRHYLGQIRVHTQRRRLRILAYCLMTNRVHLARKRIPRPTGDDNR